MVGTMATREIRTTQANRASACDVCGRTLLRGEQAHPFLEGSEPRTVCELCTSRAAQAGWLREGTVPSFAGRPAERRSLLGRLRGRREAAETRPEPAHQEDGAPRPVPRPLRRLTEPRHVRAVPAGLEQRIAAAVETFNRSEHPRTMAGIARSLGVPSVTIRPDAGRASLVFITVAWELSWYRYEVDLADEDEPVRISHQGGDLAELLPDERRPNAACNRDGLLTLGT